MKRVLLAVSALSAWIGLCDSRFVRPNFNCTNRDVRCWSPRSRHRLPPADAARPKPLRLNAAAKSACAADGRPIFLPPASDERIRSLARALDGDWRKCYEYVYNSIRFDRSPYIRRGAVRTLLDGEGTAADQSILLVALLKAAGYPSCSVVYEPLEQDPDGTLKSGFCVDVIGADGQAAKHGAWGWLGKDGAPDVYEAIWALNALSPVAVYPERGGASTVLAIPHFWVALELDGRTVYLDPAFDQLKPRASRLTGVYRDFSYSRSELLRQAGGSVSGDSVYGVNQSSVDAYMNRLVSDLSAAWTNANCSAADYLGKDEVVPHSGDAFFYGTYASGAPRRLDALASDELAALRFRLRMWAGDRLLCQFYLDEVEDRNVWMTCADSGTLTVRCDSAVLATASRSDRPGAVSVTVVVDRSSENVADDAMATKNDYLLRCGDAFAYSLVVNVGSPSRSGLVANAAQKLNRLNAQGAGETEKLAVALYRHGMDYEAQCQAAADVMGRFSGGYVRDFYRVGIAGQADSPFVDMGNNLGGQDSFLARMIFDSALEHSIGDQLVGGDHPSVSTVKMLEVANARRCYVYCVKSNTVDSVARNLRNVPEGFVDDLKRSLSCSEDAFAVLPQDCSLKVNDWSGFGYALFDGQSCAMVISGGLNGGYCTTNLTLNARGYGTNGVFLCTQNASVVRESASDPVSMPDGRFLDSATDLLLNRAAPLAWVRTYSSANVEDGPLGRGWSHGFETAVSVTSDADAVFGRSSVGAFIPTVAAEYVVRDLMTGFLTCSDPAKRYVVASLVVQWWTRFLAQNAVAVRLGDRTWRFSRNGDGSYAAYPGETVSLARSADGRYELRERLGQTFDFTAEGVLSKITDRSGNVTSLSYSDGRLVRVTGPFDAALDIAWTGDRIAKVTDSAGRSVSYAYADGNLTCVTDVRGSDWLYAYDPDGKGIVRKTDPDGNVLVENAYDAFGRVVTQVSNVGGEWTFGYAEPWLAWERNPLGGRLVRYYDSAGRVVAHRDRDGSLSTVERDGCGHVIASRAAGGRRMAMTYDARGRLTSVTSGEGDERNVAVSEYDSGDRLVRTVDAVGRATKFEYDACDRLVKRTRPDGTSTVNSWTAGGLLGKTLEYSGQGVELQSTEWTYGDYGLPVGQVVRGYGLPAGGLVREWSYDAAGNAVWRTDANGNRTSCAYDSGGNLLEETSADGARKTFDYSRSGRCVRTTDAAGRSVDFVRSPSGKILTARYPNGSTVSNEYDALDALVATTDGRGGRVAYVRDALGRVVTTQRAHSRQGVAYDANGDVREITNSLGQVVSYEYDSLGRRTAVVNALGASFCTYFDKVGRPVATVDALGKVAYSEYDAAGRRVSAVSPAGFRRRYEYDALGNFTAFVNEEGNRYVQVRDALGRVVAVTNGVGARVQDAVYDGNGNVTCETDGNGTVLTSSYDVMNRLISLAGEGVDSRYAYDRTGNLVSAEGNGVSETFGYDCMDNLEQVDFACGSVRAGVTYRRDRGGLVTNVAYAVGKAVSRAYDEDGRLVSVSDWLGHEWRFSYDGESRLVGQRAPNGIESRLSYDAAGRLTALAVGDVYGRTFAYDAADRRIRDEISGGSLPVAGVGTNRENAFDAADRLVRSKTLSGETVLDEETFSHDGNGALTKVVGRLGEKTLSYTAEGRLASLDWEGARRTFSYDALGNCVRDGDDVLLVDFDDPLRRPLAEFDQRGKAVRYYIWGGGRLLGFVDSDDVLTVAHCDSHGSVVALSDLAGAVRYRANYDPRGRISGETGDNPTRYGWLGGCGVRRVADGLYLTRHRLYSAEYQRFLSADPAGMAGGANLYAYANGNPVACFDPSGLCADEAKYLNWEERFWGSWDSEKFANRLYGVQKILDGSAEALTGLCIALFGASAEVASAGSSTLLVTGGIVIGGHGGTVAYSGFHDLFTGESSDSLLSQHMQNQGVSRETANFVDSSISLLGSWAGTFAKPCFAKAPAAKAPTVKWTGPRPTYWAQTKAALGSGWEAIRSGKMNGENLKTVGSWLQEYGFFGEGGFRSASEGLKTFYSHAGSMASDMALSTFGFAYSLFTPSAP